MSTLPEHLMRMMKTYYLMIYKLTNMTFGVIKGSTVVYFDQQTGAPHAVQ